MGRSSSLVDELVGRCGIQFRESKHRRVPRTQPPTRVTSISALQYRRLTRRAKTGAAVANRSNSKIGVGAEMNSEQDNRLGARGILGHQGRCPDSYSQQ